MRKPADDAKPTMHFSTNHLGYVAAFAVLTTFMLKEMLTLRLMAITSNFLFVGYAFLAGLEPILLLHAVLIPVNAMRLAQVIRDRKRRRWRLFRSAQCVYQLRRLRRGARRQASPKNAEPARLLGRERLSSSARDAVCGQGRRNE